MQFTRQQVNALRISRAIEILRPIYLDTETTGLSAKDQVVELAVIDHDGTVLINILMTPTCPMTQGAAATHGITDEMLAGKIPLKDWWPTISKQLNGRFIVGYNVAFDLRMLFQTAGEQGVQIPSVNFMGVFDMMQIYSAFASDIRQFGHAKWFKLGDACNRMGLQPTGDLHRALADTDLTRRLVLAMSELYVKQTSNQPEQIAVMTGN